MKLNFEIPTGLISKLDEYVDGIRFRSRAHAITVIVSDWLARELDAGDILEGDLDAVENLIKALEALVDVLEAGELKAKKTIVDDFKSQMGG
jgi:metal-responsive CopG/Arc/MetJ family transcriptional regulator